MAPGTFSIYKGQKDEGAHLDFTDGEPRHGLTKSK